MAGGVGEGGGATAADEDVDEVWCRLSTSEAPARQATNISTATTASVGHRRDRPGLGGTGGGIMRVPRRPNATGGSILVGCAAGTRALARAPTGIAANRVATDA